MAAGAVKLTVTPAFTRLLNWSRTSTTNPAKAVAPTGATCRDWLFPLIIATLFATPGVLVKLKDEFVVSTGKPNTSTVIL